MTLLGPPGADEYAPGYAGYVARLPACADLLQILAAQLDTTAGRLGAVP
jgi:hypothetical protein